METDREGQLTVNKKKIMPMFCYVCNKTLVNFQYLYCKVCNNVYYRDSSWKTKSMERKKVLCESISQLLKKKAGKLSKTGRKKTFHAS